jgi:23S rRNA (uracil1939-C5)-methyltransferase
MVCLVVNNSQISHEDKLIFAIREACPAVASIVININTRHDNVILGKKCVTLWGKDYITDILCGNKINISALSFYQVNRLGAEGLYRCAANFAGLKENDTIIDLYCGTGTIGLSMAKKVKRLIGVEIIPEAIEDAKVNAEINGITNAEFICDDAGGAAKKFAEQNVKPNVIFVDPPRKGCSPDVIEAIAKMSPEKVVMVSCDSATMSRDCALLKGVGYNIEKVQPADMFPRTAHVETVVLMSRVEK